MYNDQLHNVLTAFLPTKPKQDFIITPFGSGHIHHTYKVKTTRNSFLLQGINQQVFSDVTGMMDNIELVTSHIQNKLKKNEHSFFTTMEIIPTVKGELFYKTSDNNYWRLCTFLENTTSYNRVTSQDIAEEAGKAFGLFQVLLADLPTERLSITIPNFHNMAVRLQNLDKAIVEDNQCRVQIVKKEIRFVEKRRKQMLDFFSEISSGNVPVRVTHNDTKLNNILLDASTQKARAVIDLDTVMPGSLLFDFGDALRTICNICEEDEQDVSNIDFSMLYFQSYAKGYFKEMGKEVTKKERELLVSSVKYMTIIMGIRFLTDYLQGDIYYKTQHANHNLQRVKAQFKLLTCIEEKEEILEQILQNSANNFF